MRFLSDHRLRFLISNGNLRGPIEDLEPASIDVPLGGKAWVLRAPILPTSSDPAVFEDAVSRYSLAELNLTNPILVPPRTTVLIKTDVEIDIPENHFLGANAKSSTGRVDVLARTILPRSPRYDRAEADGAGHQSIYVEVTPLTFPITLQTGVKLTQIRFGDLADPPPVALKTLSIDLSGPIAGYRAKKSTPPIVFGANGTHRPKDFFEPVTACNGEIVFDVEAFYILATKEFIHIPNNGCGILRKNDDELASASVHLAGFLDPGFGLLSPSKLVLEMRPRDVPLRSVDGQPIATLELFHLTEAPSKAYGDGRISYQGQGLRLSRLFTD